MCALTPRDRFKQSGLLSYRRGAGQFGFFLQQSGGGDECVFIIALKGGGAQDREDR